MKDASSDVIQIRIVYAYDDSNMWDRTCEFSEKVTITQVVEQSGFLKAHPAFALDTMVFGVFGKVRMRNDVLIDGDRVEIYRPLNFDPKVSRRRRAIHRQKARNIKKKVPIDDLTQ